MILTRRRQRHVLAAMHTALRESDPRLVARFTMFTELAGDAAMPAAGRVRRKRLRWRARGPLRWRARGAGKDRVRRGLGGVLFLPALALAVLVVVMLLNQGQARGGCAPARTAAATQGTHMFISVSGGTTPGQQGISCSGR